MIPQTMPTSRPWFTWREVVQTLLDVVLWGAVFAMVFMYLADPWHLDQVHGMTVLNIRPGMPPIPLHTQAVTPTLTDPDDAQSVLRATHFDPDWRTFGEPIEAYAVIVLIYGDGARRVLYCNNAYDILQDSESMWRRFRVEASTATLLQNLSRKATASEVDATWLPPSATMTSPSPRRGDPASRPNGAPAAEPK